MANALAGLLGGIGGKAIADIAGGSGNNPYAGINLPSQYTDPLETETQGTLNTLGKNVLSGNLPDFYSSLGKANSPQFQAMLANVMKNTQQGVLENAAQSGTIRGGTVQTATGEAMSNIVPQLTYQDFLNAQQQQTGLLQFGANIESGVRDSAQQNSQFTSNYNQQLYEDQLQKAGLVDQINTRNAGQLGQMLGTIGGGALGFAVGGPAGAMAGAGMGSSAFGGGGTSGGGFGTMMPYINQNYQSPQITNGYNGASGGTYAGLKDQLGGFGGQFNSSGSVSNLANKIYYPGM